MKPLLTLLLIAALAYGAWPLYSIYRIDDALGSGDLEALEEMTDLEAVRAEFKRQWESAMQRTGGSPQPGGLVGWLQNNLNQLGGQAVDQVITMEWVREALRDAVIRAADKPRPYFIGSIDFAFFESYNRFLIRLGDLGEDPTHLVLRVEDKIWRISGIYR